MRNVRLMRKEKEKGLIEIWFRGRALKNSTPRGREGFANFHHQKSFVSLTLIRRTQKPKLMRHPFFSICECATFSGLIRNLWLYPDFPASSQWVSHLKICLFYILRFNVCHLAWGKVSDDLLLANPIYWIENRSKGRKA